MPRVIEKTIYQFAELSDAAKERAREWWRGCLDSNDYDVVLEDAAEIAELMGIALGQQRVELLGGGVRYDPIIYWALSNSQGDGAYFEGLYSYVPGAARKVREHAPEDAELHRITGALQDIQRRNFYRITARCVSRGYDANSQGMGVEVERGDGRELTADAADVVARALRDFADWIYGHLRKEDEYLNSDEHVDEAIELNEYEFDETGRRAED